MIPEKVSPMINNGILILSHCGYSFVEQITEMVKNLNFLPLILSSKPQNDNRKKALKEINEHVFVTHAHNLEWKDIHQEIIKYKKLGISIHCCISVWEGYRFLMSRTNHYLKIDDMSEDKIILLTNKLKLRKKLKKFNLSFIDAELFTKEIYEKYIKKPDIDVNKFIKPCHGIASIGTFKFSKDLKWENIQAIEQEWALDIVYSSILQNQNNHTFMIEDFINGIEYSFEILFFNHQMTCLAVHEKTETTFGNSTTLENACVCPPYYLSFKILLDGLQWLENIFKVLDINIGCFHVEAKYTNNNIWEIIEINPRIGGALISQSVKYFTKGHSILELWLKSLIYKPNNIAFEQLLKSLNISKNGMSPHNQGTFFRVYFASKGVIKSIFENSVEISPSLTQILVKPGQEFISDARENFAAQALWTMELTELKSSFNLLMNMSENLLTIEYENKGIL